MTSSTNYRVSLPPSGKPAAVRHPKATKHDSRRSNLRTTLELVSQRGATSRAEISRQTGLTRAAVSSLVGELIDQGLLRELGQGTSAGGKPPTLLALNERGRDIVALDLGDRPFRAALVDLGGRIHERASSGVPGGMPTGDAARRQAIKLIGSLIQRAAAPVLGIGVGTPGIVDVNGRAVESANLDWHGLDLAADLENRFGVPVSMANDAQVAALAELRRRPDHRRNLLLVKLGWGVGAGVVINGLLHRGDHAAAGEIGHLQVVPEGEPCRCGNRGCLETVASVPAILRRLGADPERHAWDAIALAGMAGDEPVQRALVEAGRHLGGVLAGAVSLLDVTTVVLASELRNAGDVLVDHVTSEIRRRALPTTAELVQVEATPLGPDLVLAGAASAVLADRLGVILR
ncbi:MAG: ROK family transcriptional regulator [Actinomycetota bacterium]